MLKGLFGYFLLIPRLFIQLFLSHVITFNPVLNFSEYPLHEDSLRTNPPTENTTKYYREENDKHQGGQHPDHKKKEILWPENLAEDYELPFENIKQQKRLPIYFNKWSSE